MSRRSWWLLMAAVVVLCASFQSVRAADEVRSGTKFNPAKSGQRVYVRRTVDSTGAGGFVHQAGRVDSAVIIGPFQSMPVPVTVGGVYAADTSSRAMNMDGNGNPIVTLSNAPQDYELISANFLSSLFLNAGGTQITGTVTVDSSLAVDTGGYSRLALLIEPTLDDSATCAAIGFKVRVGINNGTDSTSVYTVPMRSSFAGASTIGVADSLGSLCDVNQALLATDSTAAANERVLMVYGNGKWFGPRNQIVYLTDRNNQPITGPYISVAWRILQTYGAFPALTANGYLRELRVTCRAHLIGWR